MESLAALKGVLAQSDQAAPSALEITISGRWPLRWSARPRLSAADTPRRFCKTPRVWYLSGHPGYLHELRDSMRKSDLITILVDKRNITQKQADTGPVTVDIFECMTQALCGGDNIENPAASGPSTSRSIRLPGAQSQDRSTDSGEAQARDFVSGRARSSATGSTTVATWWPRPPRRRSPDRSSGFHHVNVCGARPGSSQRRGPGTLRAPGAT